MHKSNYVNRGGRWFHPVHMKVFTHEITILGFIR